MSIKKLSVLINVWIVADAYSILCLFPYPGRSHNMVFEPLLDELALRGHNLTVVSFFPSPKSVSNRRDVSLRGLAPLNVEIIDLKELEFSFFGLERYVDHVTIVTKLAKANLKLCKTILDSEVFDEFVKVKGNYDIILVEHFTSDCMLSIVHSYGVPSVGLMSCPALPWSPSRVGAPDNPSYVPGMTLPLVDKMTFVQRIENTFFLFFYLLWYEVAIRWEEQKIVEKKLGRNMPPLEDIGKNASVVLINTHHSWNGVRVFPPSVVEVGGIHLHKRRVQDLPPKLERWASSAKSGFILFSLGSLIRTSSMTEDKLRVILDVFSRLPQRIIWKWESDIDHLPDNVLMLKWLPQYDLLHHNNCVAFITHGGMLSLTESVSAGVPALVVPILGDQFGNAEHARHSGFAHVLRLRDLNKDSLHASLQLVLTAGMRSRAKQIREIWQDRQHPPMETAIFHIERVARHNGLDMSSDARWINRLQLALIDIIALVLVLLAVIVFVIYNVCVKCGRMLFN